MKTTSHRTGKSWLTFIYKGYVRIGKNVAHGQDFSIEMILGSTRAFTIQGISINILRVRAWTSFQYSRTHHRLQKKRRKGHEDDEDRSGNKNGCWKFPRVAYVPSFSSSLFSPPFTPALSLSLFLQFSACCFYHLFLDVDWIYFYFFFIPLSKAKVGLLKAQIFFYVQFTFK